jgi:Type II secretion system (T2SS), protein G
MKSRMVIALGTVMATLVTGCAIFDSCVTKIPPRSSTHGTIWVMKQRILRYAKLHNALPKSPKDLPEIPEKINRVQDAWGREIRMSFADGKATLTSLGRDGNAGGTGEDADMVGIFPLKDANGAWAAEDVDWIQEPRL